jgi:hypothetical protein
MEENSQLYINNDNKNKDEAFNRLQKLQILLKKESALKELCKFLFYLLKLIFRY